VGRRFRSQKYTPPPPPQPYVPVRTSVKPRFYKEIEEISQVPYDSPLWTQFVTEVVSMPEAMTQTVQEAIRGQRWKIAPNPLAAVRTAAHQEARKMGL